MNKKIIRLTESDLHRIVKQSVNRILREMKDNQWKLNGIGFGINQTKKSADMDEIEKEGLPQPEPLTPKQKKTFKKRSDKNFLRNFTLHRYHLLATDLLNGKESTFFHETFKKDVLKGDTLFKCEELERARSFLKKRYGIIPVVNIMNKTKPEHHKCDDHYIQPEGVKEPIFIPKEDMYSFMADIKFKPGQIVDKEEDDDDTEMIKFSPEDEPEDNSTY